MKESLTIYLTHECGGYFPLNTQNILKSLNSDTKLKCTYCFEEISPRVIESLKKFTTSLHDLFGTLTDNGFTISFDPGSEIEAPKIGLLAK